MRCPLLSLTLIYITSLFLSAKQVKGDSDLPNGLAGPYGPVSPNLNGSIKYYYAQPRLPSKVAINDPQSYTVSKDFVITKVPTTRQFYWVIDVAQAAPDGYPRQVYTINNRYPGPLIEANEGDRIIVHVINKLKIPQTIHWHGILQNGTNDMDGVPGFSQCPIPPGSSFTYDFTLTAQFGTYWWHSHYRNTMADGLVGAFIIHSPRDLLSVRGKDWDEEMVVLISDWMDLQSDSVIRAFRTIHGYKNTPAPPQTDAGLINGVGQTNCSNDDIQDHTLPCNPPAPYEIKVPINKRVKLRIINTSTDAMWRVSIDDITMDVVEIDSTPVLGPQGVHEIPINVAQRTSVIIQTGAAPAGKGNWFRINQVLACLGRGHPLEGKAILRRVDSKGHSPSTAPPKTLPWVDLAGANAKCEDIDREYAKIPPLYPQPTPNTSLQTQALSTKFGEFVDYTGTHFSGFGVVGSTPAPPKAVTWTIQKGYPLLSQIRAGHTPDSRYIATVNFPGTGAADLIINNLDTFITHPYHLHGREFFIVARGQGNMTVQRWEKERGSLADLFFPLIRDTITVGGGEYAVLRIVTDDPGVWPFHCHIGWHLSQGKMAAVVVRSDQIRKQNPPPLDWKLNCLITGKNAKDKYGKRDPHDFDEIDEIALVDEYESEYQYDSIDDFDNYEIVDEQDSDYGGDMELFDQDNEGGSRIWRERSELGFSTGTRKDAKRRVRLDKEEE